MKKVGRTEPVRVRLLGPPTIQRNGQASSVETRKALALLAFLAVERRSHGRASLIALLWPDAGETKGRAVLRRTLHALTKVLPEGILRTEQDRVALGEDPCLWIDIDQVRTTHARCVETPGRCHECPSPLRAAVDLCSEDFLAGFTLKDSVAFDDWQFFQAEAFRRVRGCALERLIGCLSAAQDWEAAIEYASRWLAAETLDEAPHLALMRLYALAWRLSAALRQYETCRNITRKELGGEPSPGAQRLAQDIHAGRFPPLAAGPRRGPSAEADRAPSTGSSAGSLKGISKEVSKGESAGTSTGISAGIGRHPATLLALRLVEPVREPVRWRAPQPGQGQAPALVPASAQFLSSLYGLVLRYGGWIEGQVGQTIVIVFGRGSTRESAPELAVRAAIEARAAARRHHAATAAGIATGLIAVAPGPETASHAEPLSGPAVAEARQLAAVAQGGEILVCESTFRSTRAVSRYTLARGPKQKTRCYRLGALLEEPRKARGIEGLGVRLVGRDGELAKLRQGLQEVVRGGQRLITVIGAVGVGKSRLVAEGREALRGPEGEAATWLEGRCLDVGVGAAYWPLIDMLRHFFTWRPEDSDRKHLDRIEQALGDLERRDCLAPGRRAAVARYLFLLLSGTDPDTGRDAAAEDPEARRAGIFEAVRDLFEAVGRNRPLVLVFEDLHWADALTLDLIGFLMDSLSKDRGYERARELGAGRAREGGGVDEAPPWHALGAASRTVAVPALGLVCVYRPEPDHRCRHLPALAAEKCPQRYTEILLRDLTPEQSAELVEALLGTPGLPQSLNQAILDRSQGNPFFVEEIVRSLIDTRVLYRGHGRWRARAGRAEEGVPESVESVIRGTTDRLPGDARRVLQAASVLGRVFDAQVLQGMLAPAGTEPHLRLLEGQGLVYEERTVPRREFSFRHVLTREAVYAGMAEPDRRELHELAARVILELSGGRPGPYLESLAFHYESAGLPEQGVRYLHQAAQKAIRASDNEAAIGLAQRALALVRARPAGAERDAAELEILVTLGVPVTATTGYGSPDTRSVYHRAVELCRPADRSPSAFAAAYGLWRFHTVRGELGPSEELVRRLMVLSRDLDDDAMRLEAQRALAVTLVHSGRVEEACPVLQAGIEAYDPARHRGNAFVYGHDPAATFYCYRALGLWLQGYPDLAAAAIDRLWDLLRDSSHRLSLTYACSIGAQVFQLRGDVHRVQSMSARGISLAAEGHLPMFGGFAEIMQGWAAVMSGEVAAGVRRMREGTHRWDGASGGSFRPYLRSLLAEALRRSGDMTGAARLLHDTTRELESGRCDRMLEPELYRLRGEIHLDAGETALAEPLLKTAAARAEAGGAVSLQLRAAMSLARLQVRLGEPRIARELVRRAVGLIHGGQDTSDLREAAGLLAEQG